LQFLKRIYGPFVSGQGAVGLLIFRVAAGLFLMAHGWGKIQHPFSWMPPGAPVPGVFQFLAAFSEFFGGLAFVVGLLTPIAAFGVYCTMAVAMLTAHASHPFIAQGGGPSKEPAMMYLLIATVLMLVGPGALSLDAFLFGRKGGATRVADL